LGGPLATLSEEGKRRGGKRVTSSPGREKAQKIDERTMGGSLAQTEKQVRAKKPPPRGGGGDFRRREGLGEGWDREGDFRNTEGDFSFQVTGKSKPIRPGCEVKPEGKDQPAGQLKGGARKAVRQKSGVLDKTTRKSIGENAGGRPVGMSVKVGGHRGTVGKTTLLGTDLGSMRQNGTVVYRNHWGEEQGEVNSNPHQWACPSDESKRIRCRKGLHRGRKKSKYFSIDPWMGEMGGGKLQSCRQRG